jgi:serine/threonine protein kinase/tetratricopeptide (TPR) repeat protein
VRERLAKLERAGLLPVPDEPPVAIPEQLGEFRLLQRIGSGGMGVVFLAEQLSLGRTVALKLVRPEQRFFPGARARFRREVEAIARLGDAGIVPIHSVGEDQGIDFFTMEYVRGASLAEVVASVQGRDPAELDGRTVASLAAAKADAAVQEPLPAIFAGTWVQTCCHLVARMARAAHHAHERGVVHRDLKPSNAMVTPDGRVLLLDFGLAAADGTSRITRTGALIGTVHYMAPEQLRDGTIDVRTDVYALGVTLHELLALAPPFDAGTSEALRQSILHGDATPLRAKNRDVPRDVETIVAVAMERDPQRRYASAGAFAADLERFLQHRPIHARPAGPWLRARRWSQRHPALATAGALLLTAAIATPFLIHVTRGDVDARVQVARDQAQANLMSAIDAIQRIVQSARSGTMSRTPGLDAERLQQLAVAVELMQRLRRENPDDPAVLRPFARGMLRVAQVRQLMGDNEAALADLDEIAPILANLRTSRPDDAEVLVDHLGAAMIRGSTLVGLARFADAEAIWRHLLEDSAGIDLDAASVPLLQTLSSCHNNLSRMHHSRGELEPAIAHLETALALDARLAKQPRTVDQVLDAARTRLNLGNLQRGRNQIDAAAECFLAVRAELEELAAKQPDEPELRRELARSEFALAKVATERKDFAAAAPLRTTALAAFARLVADFPARVAYRQDHGLMAFESSCDAQIAGDREAAMTLIDTAIAQHEALLLQQPDHPEYGSELATFQRQRSGLLVAAGRMDEAIALVQKAIELQERIANAHADDAHHRIQLAGLLQELGIYHWRRERWPAARDALARAGAAYEAAVAKGHAPALEPRRLPKLLAVLAQAEHMCDDADGVLRALTRLQAIRPMPKAVLRDLGNKLDVTAREDFQSLLRAAPDDPVPNAGTK